MDARDKNAELRRPFYGDVEALLCPGFLSHPYRIGAVECCLRSPSPGDFHILRARVGVRPTQRAWMEWSLSTCTWMVDGQMLLEDPRATTRIRQALRSLPSGALQTTFAIFTGLYNRVSSALSRLESYCYEHYSRGLWRMCGRENPGREDFSGIPGSSRLGQNYVQRLWVAYNLAEDARLEEQASWAAAKLVASAHAPKGVKKLNASDQRRHRTEEERRKNVQDQMYWAAVGRSDMAGRRTTKRAVSPTVLVEEMRRWVAGEMVDHDRVVEAQKQKIRERYEAEQRDRERKRRLLEAQQQIGVGGGRDLVGYSLDSLGQVTRGKPPGRRPGARKVFEGPDAGALYRKNIAQAPKAGVLRAGEEGVLIEQKPSLDRRIRSRKVRVIDPNARGD